MLLVNPFYYLIIIFKSTLNNSDYGNHRHQKIKDLTLEELESLVASLENMANVADKSAMREQLIKITQKVKRGIAKRLKTL